MAVTVVTPDDLDWAVEVLRRRRLALVPHAPVFWRPAADADAHHRAHLAHLLVEGSSRAWRTPTSVLVAARRGGAGWLVDDAHVDGERWAAEGAELWNAFSAGCAGDEVRFVVPTYETERASLAAAAGLGLAESWWLRELAGPGGGAAGVEVVLTGADAVTVAAPPVYAPPGPILLVQAVDDVNALPPAVDHAIELGCAGVVVSQRAGEGTRAPALADAGFRRHCDFYEGPVRPV